MELFDAIEVLYKKNKGLEWDDLPPDYILHRFLSSDPKLAKLAKEFAIISNERKRTWKLWWDFIPKTQKKPYLSYVAPKKKKYGELAERYRDVTGKSISQVEQDLEIIEAQGEIDDLKMELGVE